MIDDALMAAPLPVDPDYALRVIAEPGGTAVWTDVALSHRSLANKIKKAAPIGLGPLVDDALSALWRGSPLRPGGIKGDINAA